VRQDSERLAKVAEILAATDALPVAERAAGGGLDM
jgi:hypothetical protein